MNGARPISAATWTATARLEPREIDCVTAVMLKILDGKCKMIAVEKEIMEQLYDLLKQRAGERLSATVHDLILVARHDRNPELQAQVYEERVLAETLISRPVMKGFKARLRREGVLPEPRDDETAEDDAP